MGAQVAGRGQVAIAASAVGYGVGTALSVVALHGLRPADEGVGRTAWQFLGATLAVLPFVLGSWWTGGSRITTAEPHQLAAAAAVLLCGLGALLAFNIGIGTVSASRGPALHAAAAGRRADRGRTPRRARRRGTGLRRSAHPGLPGRPDARGTDRSPDPDPDPGRGRARGPGPDNEMRHTMATRSSLFCDTALARRIERAETGLITDTSRATQARTGTEGFLIPIAGGMASFAEPDSPFNKVVGLGFDGVPIAAELDVIEKAFADRGAPTQVELAHLAESAIGELLSDRGYRLESFENVLGLALDGDQERVTPPGIEVRRSTADELDAWIAVVADASTYQDTQGLPWHDEFPREAIENAERDFAAAGGVRYAAFRDGVLAGGADFRITEGIAQLAGAATAPAHRRHGVQSALVAARLADAHAAGCDVGVIITQPGSKSQENAQRRGFDLLYTRATLVKHP